MVEKQSLDLSPRLTVISMDCTYFQSEAFLAVYKLAAFCHRTIYILRRAYIYFLGLKQTFY